MADWLASNPMLFRFVDIALATPRQAGPRENPKERATTQVGEASR